MDLWGIEDMNMNEDWGCYRSNVSFIKVVFRENHFTRFFVVFLWLILFTIYTKCCKLKCRDVLNHWFGCFCCRRGKKTISSLPNENYDDGKKIS